MENKFKLCVEIEKILSEYIFNIDDKFSCYMDIIKMLGVLEEWELMKNWKGVYLDEKRKKI